ncbi:MAG: diguanylate cyclase [Rhodobacterales bacterium]
MPGRILIVDDIATNRILLRVRLSAAYYDVVQASTATEALSMLARHSPDLVLLSARLGDCDTLALCRAMSGRAAGPDNKPDIQHDSPPAGDGLRPPVLILSDQIDRSLRLAALNAGAEDVIAFPADDLLLQARLRSLMRVGDAAQESQLRDATSRTLGFAEDATAFVTTPRICILSDMPCTSAPWQQQLDTRRTGRISAHDSATFLRDVSAGDKPDLCLIVMHHPRDLPGLRLLSELRAHPETRHAAVIVILPDHDPQIAADALDLGAGDIMTGDVDPAELVLRVGLQIRRKRLADQLRSTLHNGLRAAVTDQLTGLYNRRYALPHLARLAEQSTRSGRRFAVMLADLDHFKAINDRYGHAAGDAVLVEVAQRLRANLRAVDLVARIGGEEFLIALPDTNRTEARIAARRLCRIIAQDPFVLPGKNLRIPLTVSIGVTMGHHTTCAALPSGHADTPPQDAVQHLLQQADEALYGAKACGRNQVTLSKPAA